MRSGGFGRSCLPLPSARPTNPDGTEGPQAKGGGPLSPDTASPLLQVTPAGSAAVVPERSDMPELVVTALLAPSRLSLKLLRAFMWSLVFSVALVAAAVYGCIAFTHVLCRPRRGCCGRRRSACPACLSDPSLGEHGFLNLQVIARGRYRGCGVVWGRDGSSLGREGSPGFRLCPPPRARACVCTMSRLDKAKDPSCCFCTASLRTGTSGAQGPEAHGTRGQVELGFPRGSGEGCVDRNKLNIDGDRGTGQHTQIPRL